MLITTYISFYLNHKLIIIITIIYHLIVHLKPYSLTWNQYKITTAHPWCGGHSTSINTCGVWEVRAGEGVSHTYTSRLD